MGALSVPRPRTFDDLVDRIERVEARLVTVSDGVIDLSQSVGKLLGEVGRMKGGGSALPPMRERESSFTELEPELAQYREALKERVRDPNDRRFDSQHARAMVKEAIDRAGRDDKAAKWDAFWRTGRKVSVGIIVGVIVAMVLAHFGIRP